MTRALRWLVSVGVLATVVTGCGEGAPVAGGASQSSSSPAAAAVSSDVTTTAAPTTTTATTTAAPTTTTTTAPTTTTTPPGPPSSAATAPTPPVASTPTQWVVQPGESFWSIAVGVADSRAGGHATTRAVDTVWRALIEANRARLPKPRNPSLLYVGTILTVPP